MTTLAEARDAMLAHATAAVSGTPISYDDVPAVELDGTAQWARATIRHAVGGQKGFGDNTRRFVRIGVLCIEVFSPKGDGLTANDTKVEAVLTYLENVKSSPIWYRNIRANEIPGGDGKYAKTNIYADFQYDSIH